MELKSKIVHNMYKRKIEKYLSEIGHHFPIISITGPRQSGKTTLCRMMYEDRESISSFFCIIAKYNPNYNNVDYNCNLLITGILYGLFWT